MLWALQSRCPMTAGPAAANMISRLAAAIWSIHAAPVPGRLEVEERIVGGRPERVARHRSRGRPCRCRSGAVSRHEPRQRRCHAGRTGGSFASARLAVVPVLLDRGVAGAERLGSDQHARTRKPRAARNACTVCASRRSAADVAGDHAFRNTRRPSASVSPKAAPVLSSTESTLATPLPPMNARQCRRHAPRSRPRRLCRGSNARGDDPLGR